MSQQKLFLIIGAICVVIALVVIFGYIEQQRQIIKKQAAEALANLQKEQVAVLVAKSDIPQGVALEPEMLDTMIIPRRYLQPKAVVSLDRIAGMITIAPIAKGEQITLNRLSPPKEAASRVSSGALADLTPIGKRAITIPVDNIASLAGMIKPGDYVDVIAVMPVPSISAEGKQVNQVAVVPLFQNVLVLATGQETVSSRYKKEEKKEVPPFITLALSPQEANLIAFVQEQGKIRLILRSPADAQIQMLSPASWSTLLQYIMPPEAYKPETEPVVNNEENKTKELEKASPVDYVEIYRGLNKEKVPLSKE